MSMFLLICDFFQHYSKLNYSRNSKIAVYICTIYRCYLKLFIFMGQKARVQGERILIITAYGGKFLLVYCRLFGWLVVNFQAACLIKEPRRLGGVLFVGVRAFSDIETEIIIMKLTHIFTIFKSMQRTSNGKNIIHYLFAGSHKRIRMYQ